MSALTPKQLTLAQISRRVDNIIKDKLATFSLGTHIGGTSGMPLSLETQRVITKRNQYTHQVIAALKADRKKYRDQLRESKKELDGSP